MKKCFPRRGTFGGGRNCDLQLMNMPENMRPTDPTNAAESGLRKFFKFLMSSGRRWEQSRKALLSGRSIEPPAFVRFALGILIVSLVFIVVASWWLGL